MAVELSSARKHLQARIDGMASTWLDLHRKAEADVRVIIAMIIERYKPQRIYQWGSVLNPASFRDYSDIDIALEGLGHPMDLLHILRDAETLTDFPLDIVELEKIDPIHAESIRSKGKCVYER
ncbi:MAG: nucleotidyltransferase domain-containing protein [Fibrobacterota bacterium]